MSMVADIYMMFIYVNKPEKESYSGIVLYCNCVIDRIS